MDNINNLPLKEDIVPSIQEREVMNNFFESSNGEVESVKHKSSKKSTSEGNSLNWKALGYSAILFFLLANPWIDSILCSIPYCGGNAMSMTALKTVIFVMIYIIIVKFLG